jgi:membrane peptidoglycan carboxypeptidase
MAQTLFLQAHFKSSPRGRRGPLQGRGPAEWPAALVGNAERNGGTAAGAREDAMTARRPSRTTATVPLRPTPGRGGSALALGGVKLTTPGSRSNQARPGRRRLRRLRRFLGTVLALALLAVAGFTGLMLITPSVGNAPELTRALDLAHRAPYPGPPVPARFEAALVAAQDQRFSTEASLDPTAVARVLIGHLSGGSGQSGSTIVQQLARILYLHQRSGLVADEEQALLGIKLAYSYSRAQILRMYADVIYFGRGYYGLAAASCGYFTERPARLSWAQAATLVALAQAPVANDPLEHLANARAGEASVLGQLAATGKLTRAQAAAAYRQPLHLVHSPTERARC